MILTCFCGILGSIIMSDVGVLLKTFSTITLSGCNPCSIIFVIDQFALKSVGK